MENVTSFLWQRPGWPGVSWSSAVHEPLRAAGELRKLLQTKVQGLDDEHRARVEAELYTRETVSTSAIEGVQIDAAAARSSVIRRLHLGHAADRDWQVTDQTRGLIDILADSTRNPGELTEQRLKDWHQALFPTGKIGLRPILAGEYRSDAMEIVSSKGTGAYTKVHFIAPPPERIAREMAMFVEWFNGPSRGLDATLRGCFAHLYFETIHPFEDGNGRLGRALWDLAMIQAASDPAPQLARLWAVSPVIQKRKEEYWTQLEQAQRGDLDITPWLLFAISCVTQAYEEAGQCIDRVTQIAWFWVRHRTADLNQRQRRALELALSSQELDDGWLTNRRYMKLSQASNSVTAARDLASLETQGLIRKDPESKGRSTRYQILL